MVEFAIILPLLLIITFAIIEFGILLYDQQVITNASREGARAGIVAKIPRLTAEEIKAVVLNYCSTYLVTFGTNPNLRIDPDPPTVSGLHNTIATAASGDILTVTVKYTYSFLVLPDLLLNFFGSGFNKIRNLQSTTTMSYE